MKSYSETEIKELINNPDDFKNAIIESNGFILYLADKYTIDLSKELLIQTINPYSIRFISEHMESHKYSSEQTAIVIAYLTEDKDINSSNIVTEYSLKNLIQDIKEENNIPRNVDKLLKLSFEDFLLHSKEFVQLIYRSNDSYWGADEFYSSNFLLEPIFKNLSKEEFLQIDREILNSCPALFHMSNHLMNDDEIRILFNDIVQSYYKHPTRVKGGYKPKLESYKHYTFRPEEKELFLSLLNNDYSKDYKTIKKYNGFDHFFTKNDYILTHNIGGIQYFSEKEIADNLVDIRKGILAAYFKPHYKNIEKIYHLNISKDAFKDIFNKDFVQEILDVCNGFHFHNFERDHDKKNDFINLVHKEVLNICSNDSNYLNMVGSQNLVNHITALKEHDSSYFDDTHVNAIQLILKEFDQAVNTTYLFDNTFNRKVSCYSQYDIPEIIFSNMKGKESINYLFSLIQIHDKSKAWKQKSINEEISKIIPLLNSDDVKNIAKSLNFKFDKKLLKDNVRQSFDKNFLNFTPEIIKDLSFSNFSSIFSLSKEFREMVIKNDLDYLIIDNKLSNLKSNNDFILNLLNNIENKKSPYFSFLKSFIKRNKNFMLEHYFEQLVSHVSRNDLINIDTEILEKDSYQKIEKIMQEFSEKSLVSERLSIGRDDLTKKEKKKVDELKEQIDSEKTILENEIKKEFSNISFKFYSEKINEADVVQSIYLLNISKINKNYKEYKFMVFDKIESLSFNEVKKLLSNKDFLHFIYENKVNTTNSYSEQERAVLLNPNFTKEQNIEIVEDLLKNLNNPNLFLKNYEKTIPLSKILYLIEKNKRYEISNDLAIKYDTVALFNSYDYLPQENGHFSKHVKERFSNQQLLQAIDNLTKNGLKIISHPDTNLSHDNLLSYNFEYKNKDGKNPFLSDYLDLLKSLENDPINYLACIHSDIINNFIDNKKWENRDLALTAFYNEYINFDVLITAMKDIFSLHKEMTEDKNVENDYFYKGVAIKNAVGSISNFIAFSYSSYQDIYSSEISEDKCTKIFKTLIEEAPYLIFNHSTIGKFKTAEELAINFDKYYHKNLIEDFFISCSKNHILGDNFTLDYTQKDNWNTKIAHNFITSLIKDLSEKQDSENLYKLDFIIKENKFNEDRPYGKKLKEFYSILAEFIAHKEYENLIEKSLGYIKLIKLTDRLDNKPRLKVKANKI